MNQSFPMGFWGTQAIDDVPLSDVADWAACGMTLTVAPHYSPDPERKKKLLALKADIVIKTYRNSGYSLEEIHD